MFFGRLGLQKEKCPDCNGTVFRDPIKNQVDIIGTKIVCSKCGREFSENEWPPPKMQ